MSGASPPPPRRVRFNARQLSWLFRTRMGRLVLVSYLALLGAEVLAIVGLYVPAPASKLLRLAPELAVATLSLTWLVVALVFIYCVSHQRLHRWTAVPFALMVVCFGGFIVSGTIGLALGPEAGASALAASSALLGWGLTLLPATTMLAGISAMLHLYRTSGSNPL